MTLFGELPGAKAEEADAAAEPSAKKEAPGECTDTQGDSAATGIASQIFAQDRSECTRAGRMHCHKLDVSERFSGGSSHDTGTKGVGGMAGGQDRRAENGRRHNGSQSVHKDLVGIETILLQRDTTYII